MIDCMSALTWEDEHGRAVDLHIHMNLGLVHKAGNIPIANQLLPSYWSAVIATAASPTSPIPSAAKTAMAAATYYFASPEAGLAAVAMTALRYEGNNSVRYGDISGLVDPFLVHVDVQVRGPSMLVFSVSADIQSIILLQILSAHSQYLEYFFTKWNRMIHYLLV